MKTWDQLKAEVYGRVYSAQQARGWVRSVEQAEVRKNSMALQIQKAIDREDWVAYDKFVGIWLEAEWKQQELESVIHQT